MKKIPLIIILILSFILLNGIGLYAQAPTRTGGGVVTPRVRLISPTSEVINIKDKGGILFKWSPHQIPSGGRRKFRFQLYEGYDMYEMNLIFKKELDPSTFEIFIEKDKFKDGAAYTWSIRQRGYFSNWSKRSFYSFKVSEAQTYGTSRQPMSR